MQPVIAGAKTVRVVVTGDLPPLDYVSMDGQPAGYNVALLSELSKVMNVNFELVTADAASRAAMLIFRAGGMLSSGCANRS